jgi:small subunit ribosomal protein S8
MMTSLIIDLVIRIKNGYMAEKPSIACRYSKLNMNVLTLLKKEGYVKDFAVEEDGVKKNIHVELSYEDNKGAIRGLKLVSKPGRRTYKRLQDMRPVLGGLGMSVLSTSKGIMSDREARASKIGGEILFQIW